MLELPLGGPLWHLEARVQRILQRNKAMPEGRESAPAFIRTSKTVEIVLGTINRPQSPGETGEQEPAGIQPASPLTLSEFSSGKTIPVY